MRYDDARALIDTGDLIGVRRRSGPLAVLTRLITGSDYTHTGIALWCGGRLFLAQINGGGAGFAPLSQFVDFGFDVYDCPTDKNEVERVIWDKFAVRVGYAFIILIRIALHILFKLPPPKDADGDEICSSISYRVYLLAGWNPRRELPLFPYPGEVIAALGVPPIIEVRP